MPEILAGLVVCKASTMAQAQRLHFIHSYLLPMGQFCFLSCTHFSISVEIRTLRPHFFSG